VPESKRILKVAFASIPKDSGTFTFYRNLRPELAKLGIYMYCVSVGKREIELWDEAYADDHCVKIGPHNVKIKKLAKKFVKWVIKNNIDFVFGINSKVILSSLEHLPGNIHALSRCANGFDHGYKITLSGANRLERIIALTPKLQKDLIEQYNVPPELIDLIPNGINPEPYQKARKVTRGTEGKLRIAFIGRLENTQKGVFHLPKILEALDMEEVPYQLSIAGKGRHEGVLRERLAPWLAKHKVEFVGALPANKLATFMAEQDILLFTSHFEGCPNTLLESMMAGLVPVSWLIEGTTDFIIDHGKNGFVHPTQDYAGMAKSIRFLHTNRPALQSMSQAAGTKALTEFTNQKAAEAYADMFHSVKANSKEHSAKDWDYFAVDPNFKNGLSDFLPAPVVSQMKSIKSSVLKK
jgi:glycosyltransferase involved in cell wall biosynthesis